MDDIVNIIYSDKNLSKLSEKFTSFFEDIGSSQQAQNACKTWLGKKMKNVIDINKNDLRGSKKDVVKKLNSECLKLAVNEYRSHQTGKTTGQKLNNYKMEREKELYGNRKVRVDKRPKYREENNQKGTTYEKLGSISDAGGYASFSSNTDGQVIRADGTVGDQMYFGNLNDVMQSGDKKTIAAELERRMMMRKGEYDGFDGGQNQMDGGMGGMGGMSGMGGGMGGMGGGMGGMSGMGDIGNPTMYNPNFGMQNKRPPEINFRLDGTDSRDKPQNNMNQMGQMGQNDFGGFNGFDNFSQFGNSGGMGGMGGNMNNNFMSQMDNFGAFDQNGNINGRQQNNNQNYGQDNRLMQMQQERGYANRNNNQQNIRNNNMDNYNNNFNQNNSRNNMRNYDDDRDDDRYDDYNNRNSRDNRNGRNNRNDRNDHNELANKVSNMRNHIASNIGLDPQALLYMTPDEIENQIRKQANKRDVPSYDNRRPTKKQQQESEEESESDSEEEMTQKEKLLKMIIEMKKNAMNKENGLKKAVKDVKKKHSKKQETESEQSESEQSEEEEVVVKPKKNVKFSNTVQSRKIVKEPSSDEDDSDSDNKVNSKKNKVKSTSNKNSKSVNSANNKANNGKKSREQITIDVIQDKELDAKYYSDFMIDFNEKFDRTYKNISNIQLKIKTLPELQPKINDTCNKLKIIVNSNIKNIQLEEGYYTLEEIIEGITENLSDVNIICRKDKKNRVIFESTIGENFEIDCQEDSLAKYLGFVDLDYNSDTKYISETPSALANDKIFVFFPNISSDCFCMVDNTKNMKTLYNNDDNDNKSHIDELDCLIVQIKDINTDEENYFHNFEGNKFHFILSFECDK